MVVFLQVVCSVVSILQYTSNRTQHSLKISALLFDQKCATLLWIASGFVREAYCAAFAKHAANFGKVPQFGETRLIFTGKAPKSLDYGALQNGAHSEIASKCGTYRGISVEHETPR